MQELSIGFATSTTCGEMVVKCGKIIFYITRALAMIILWPFWMLINRFRSALKSALSSTQNKFDIKAQTDEDLNASARAQIIEVAIESSFQPILQLYLLLPMILIQTSCSWNDFLTLFSIRDIYSSDGSQQILQFWSIVTSIMSLSWSFTFHQAIKKNGALDFGANFVGRMTLFLSNLLQITSRLFALILYAYSFGAGQFWPMMLSVIIHILLMAFLHYLTSNEWSLDTFYGKPWKILYHCLINGICNLYLHNHIKQINSESSERMKNIEQKIYGTIFKQILFDTIFVIENLAIILLVFWNLTQYLPSGVYAFVLLTQYVGIGLKVIYYWKFHIWKNTFSQTGSKRNIQKSVAMCLQRLKCSKTVDISCRIVKDQKVEIELESNRCSQEEDKKDKDDEDQKDSEEKADGEKEPEVDLNARLLEENGKEVQNIKENDAKSRDSEYDENGERGESISLNP